MEMGGKRPFCVLVVVNAFGSDAAWNKVYAAFRGDEDVSVQGSPRCDRASLDTHERWEYGVNLIQDFHPGDPSPLAQSIAENPGLLDMVGEESRAAILKELGISGWGEDGDD